MENCIYCNYKIPHGANFCPNCIRQIACLSCGKELNKNTPICIYCGKQIKNIGNISEIGSNKVEFTESHGDYNRNFNASFTNEVAGNVVETFAQFFNTSQKSKSLVVPVIESSDNTNLYLVDNSSQQTESNIKSSKIETEDVNYIEKLNRIFEVQDGDIALFETNIKAKSKRDAVARIVLLFLLYKRLVQDENDVARSDIKDMLGKVSIDDNNFRSWLSQNRNYLTNRNEVFRLTSESLKDAKKYVLDVFDDDIPNEWDLKNAKTNNSLKDNGTIQKKTKKTKSTTETEPITDLDLKPSNNQSLEDFYTTFNKVSSNFERNLIFVYYLQFVLKISPISVNHIHTCYLDLKIKVPNIYQSVIDTKKTKKWFDYDDMNDITVNRLGKNYLEHDLIKNK